VPKASVDGKTHPSDKQAASSDAKVAPKAVDKKAQANAKKAYNDATAAFKAGKYDAALVKYQEAESLVPSPNAEYWIAATLDKLDKPAEALAAYASLLANPDVSKAGESNVAEAKARFDALRATVPGELVLAVAPASAKASIDGQAQTDKPPFTVKLSPGDHKVLVTADGYVPQETTVGVEAAKRTNRTIELAALPPPPPEPVMAAAPPPSPPPPPPPPPQKSLVPAYVTLGIAAVAAGAGTYFGIRALSAKSDYDKTPTSSKADDVENNALIADMAFGVAITLGVTGIVLLTTPEEQPAAPTAAAVLKPKRITLSPWASTKSGGASALMEF
jgi:tetratricopeptide (TPR) repeat protein